MARLFQRYGFLGAFDPAVRAPAIRVRRGTVVAKAGLLDDNYIGIEQGLIVVMIANHRNGNIWELMTKHPDIVRGLCRAGFTSGRLAGQCQ